MTRKNTYAVRSKISAEKVRELVKLFVNELSAKQIAGITNLNRNTVNRYLRAIRERLAEYCEEYSFLSKGSPDMDKLQHFREHYKKRLSQFRGFHQTSFYLYLKECEFRFQHKGKDLSILILDILTERPLFL